MVFRGIDRLARKRLRRTLHPISFMPRAVVPRKSMRFPVDALFDELPLSEAPDDGSIDSDTEDMNMLAIDGVAKNLEEVAVEAAPPAPPLNLWGSLSPGRAGCDHLRKSCIELESGHGISVEKLA